MVSAIAIGNAAYQTGNVTGAAIGLESLTGWSRRVWSLGGGGGALALLASGAYRSIERFLIALVVVMSVVFLVTAPRGPTRSR